MIEFNAWCERCKKETGFELVEGQLCCSVCRGRQVGADATPNSSTAKSCLKVLVILLAIGLVFLAFVYAACSNMKF